VHQKLFFAGFLRQRSVADVTFPPSTFAIICGHSCCAKIIWT